MNPRVPGTWKPKIAFALAAASGVVLFAAFPPLGASSLAFVGFLPLLLALRWHPEARVRLSYLAGLCHWIPSLWFLSPVTIPGALLLAAYCALYWIPAGWAWGGVLKNWKSPQIGRSLIFVTGGAAWWCAVEGVRGWFLTGFPWNELAVSQWQNLGLLQLASVGGTPLISFLIVAMNLGIGLSLLGLLEKGARRQRTRAHPELYVPILLLTISFALGIREARRHLAEPTRSVRLAAIQPLAKNKWTEERAAKNYQVLWELSDAAASLRPDLLIWPETALPEELRYSQTAANLVRTLTGTGVPLLAGTLDFETRGEGGVVERLYYNSAFLVNTRGELAAEYRKQHLVMFGEYMPFADWLPFLRSLTPMPEDVTPGRGRGVIPFPDTDLELGMLICFEDLMPALARDRVAKGADLFVNQTNDAWFDPLWGSRAHLAHAVFRSVEQRRPTVRVTNSGVSAWIDTRGVVRNRVEDPLTGNPRIRGFRIFEVEIPENPETTVIHRWPRAPLIVCWLLSSLLMIPRKGK